MNRILALFIYLILALSCLPGQAAEIEHSLANGLIARAEYATGDAEKPAILLLHGFLTVHNTNLIKNITTELADSHYSVLAPTLTLGISKRQTTLDCKALHLHNMNSDISEIDGWVKWLIKKGHKKIILMGHSSGAVQLMEYARSQKHKEVVKYIGLSLIPLSDQNSKQFTVAHNKAIEMLNKHNDNIHNFTLSYCIDNYSAPAKEYLSYAQWNAEQTLKTLRAINIKAVIIKGSDDIPVYPDWVNDLQHAGARVEIINDADHFFGNGTEFELYDSIQEAIANT